MSRSMCVTNHDFTVGTMWVQVGRVRQRQPRPDTPTSQVTGARLHFSQSVNIIVPFRRHMDESAAYAKANKREVGREQQRRRNACRTGPRHPPLSNTAPLRHRHGALVCTQNADALTQARQAGNVLLQQCLLVPPPVSTHESSRP